MVRARAPKLSLPLTFRVYNGYRDFAKFAHTDGSGYTYVIAGVILGRLQDVGKSFWRTLGYRSPHSCQRSVSVEHQSYASVHQGSAAAQQVTV